MKICPSKYWDRDVQFLIKNGYAKSFDSIDISTLLSKGNVIAFLCDKNKKECERHIRGNCGECDHTLLMENAKNRFKNNYILTKLSENRYWEVE